MSACEKWSFCPLGDLALIDNADDLELDTEEAYAMEVHYGMMATGHPEHLHRQMPRPRPILISSSCGAGRRYPNANALIVLRILIAIDSKTGLVDRIG